MKKEIMQAFAQRMSDAFIAGDYGEGNKLLAELMDRQDVTSPQDDPNHAANAVRAGLEICGQADALTESLISKSGVPCQFGVGIHSGPVVAGNIGSSSRFNYTVIGDTVNVASRLESFGGRVYDSRLIVTREVVDLCPNIGFVLLGEVNLKGRQQAAEIYTAQSIDPNSH